MAHTPSASLIAGYFSESLHIDSFFPSAAIFILTAFINSVIGFSSLGRENIICFRIGDFNPVLSGGSNVLYASATLLNAGRRIDNSLGVHWGKSGCQFEVSNKYVKFYLPILYST